MVEIDFPVGKTNRGTTECRNRLDDQRKIIGLLNRISSAQGGTKESPLTTSGIREGVCAPGLYKAIITFQQKQRITEDGHIDPRQAALGRLNLLAPQATGVDDSLPSNSPYTQLPKPLIDTLRASYKGWTPSNNNLKEGFDGKSNTTKSFRDVLDTLQTRTELIAIQKVYNRAATYAGLWAVVETITHTYNYGSSFGFHFHANHAAAHSFLKGSAHFCGDLPVGESMHQDVSRHCYRELGCVGHAGLHICLTTEASIGGKHDMHIDPHQIVSARTKKSTCWYAGLNDHFRDVGASIVDLAIMPELDRKVAAIPSLGAVWTKYRTDVRNLILNSIILGGSADFDELEKSITKPPKWTSPLELLLFGVIHTALGEFKQWYFDNA